jgi:hypothetical protein
MGCGEPGITEIAELLVAGVDCNAFVLLIRLDLHNQVQGGADD